MTQEFALTRSFCANHQNSAKHTADLENVQRYKKQGRILCYSLKEKKVVIVRIWAPIMNAFSSSIFLFVPCAQHVLSFGNNNNNFWSYNFTGSDEPRNQNSLSKNVCREKDPTQKNKSLQFNRTISFSNNLTLLIETGTRVCMMKAWTFPMELCF